MLTNLNWNKLSILRSNQFKHPDRMHFTIVIALNSFADQVGIRPEILSDFRPGDSKQHGAGLAVDTYWHGQDPLVIWNAALKSKLFSGLGVYLNEKGIASFHFDLRAGRSTEVPAVWGAFVDKGVNSYVGAELVLEEIKKQGWLVGLVLAGVAYFVYSNRNK